MTGLLRRALVAAGLAALALAPTPALATDGNLYLQGSSIWAVSAQFSAVTLPRAGVADPGTRARPRRRGEPLGDELGLPGAGQRGGGGALRGSANRARQLDGRPGHGRPPRAVVRGRRGHAPVAGRRARLRRPTARRAVQRPPRARPGGDARPARADLLHRQSAHPGARPHRARRGRARGVRRVAQRVVEPARGLDRRPTTSAPTESASSASSSAGRVLWAGVAGPGRPRRRHAAHGRSATGSTGSRCRRTATARPRAPARPTSRSTARRRRRGTSRRRRSSAPGDRAPRTGGPPTTSAGSTTSQVEINAAPDGIRARRLERGRRRGGHRDRARRRSARPRGRRRRPRVAGAPHGRRRQHVAVVPGRPGSSSTPTPPELDAPSAAATDWVNRADLDLTATDNLHGDPRPRRDRGRRQRRGRRRRDRRVDPPQHDAGLVGRRTLPIDLRGLGEGRHAVRVVVRNGGALGARLATERRGTLRVDLTSPAIASASFTGGGAAPLVASWVADDAVSGVATGRPCSGARASDLAHPGQRRGAGRLGPDRDGRLGAAERGAEPARRRGRCRRQRVGPHGGRRHRRERSRRSRGRACGPARLVLAMPGPAASGARGGSCWCAG